MRISAAASFDGSMTYGYALPPAAVAVGVELALAAKSVAVPAAVTARSASSASSRRIVGTMAVAPLW